MGREWDAGQSAVLALPAGASGVVIGAPGTGKTTVLVERVRRLVELGHRPDSLLVLTPSRQTATALRDRLALVAGGATAGSLARSVASFAFQIVRARALAAGAEPPRLLTAADQDRIIADLLAGDEQALDDGDEPIVAWPERLGAPARRSREFRTQLRALAAECTELGLSADGLIALGRARGNEVWSAAGAFLREYRFVLDGMRSDHRDAAELVREAAASIARHDGVAGVPGWPAELSVVLVDDAQELTRAGIDLIAALRGRGVAVLAFGDPDIGSGAFRGAGPALFASLCDLLGRTHVLEEQHRCAAPLTDLVRSATAAIGVSGRVDHRRAPAGPAQGAPPATVRTVIAGSPLEEIDTVARVLREWHVLHGIPWSHMAVVAHDTRQVAELDIELAAREVPTRAAGVQHPLGREQIVRDILSFVALGMRDPSDRAPEDLTAALRSPLGGLDAIGLRRLRARLRRDERAAGGSRHTGELLCAALDRPAAAAVAGGEVEGPENRVAARVAQTLRAVHEAHARGAGIHELLWRVWDDATDLAGRRLRFVWPEIVAAREPFAAEVDHSLDALVALFAAAKRHGEQSPDDGPGPFVARILDSEVPEDTLTAPDDPDAVAVLTPDAALGTEFDAVVIAGLQDGVWPNLRLRGGLLESWRLADDVAAWRAGDERPEVPGLLDRRRAGLHDELRLFVRAVSRARDRLVVTAVDDEDLGPSPLTSFLPEPLDDPTGQREADHPLTLRGLVAAHRRALTTAASTPARRRHAAEQLVLLARAGIAGADPQEWFGLRAPSSTGPLRDPRRSPVPVSPSKLGSFEECPLDWAIRALGGDTRTWSAGVGTILHAAMEEVPGGELEALTRVVDRRWGELEFEAEWLGQKERLWAETLTARLHRYLSRFHAEGGRVLGAEARFRIAVGLDGEQPDVRVIGPDERAPAGSAVLSGSIDRLEVYAADPRAGGPDGAGDPGDRLLVVDLKTGRSEARVADAKVADDPQLAAYQLAVQEGAVDGASGTFPVGAQLVVLSQTTKTHPDYRLARQPPLTASERANFLLRVVRAAGLMSAPAFRAPIDAHCLVARYGVCAVHTVKAVSAA